LSSPEQGDAAAAGAFREKLSSVTVARLHSRLLTRRRAEKLLWEGRRLVVALNPEGAEPVLRKALSSAWEAGANELAASIGEELYQVLLRRRRVDEAVPILENLVIWRSRRLGPNAEGTAAWRNELIQRLGQLGRYAEAEPFCRERLEAAQRRRPPDPRAVAFAQVTLAWCVRSLSRWDEAERLCREAAATLDSSPVPRGSVGWALAGLAAALLRRMALDEAEAALKRAAEQWAAIGRADLVGGVEEMLMDLYVVGERHPQALAVSEAALNRSRRGAAAVADRERQLRNLDRHAFLLSIGGREPEAARYELRAVYLRQAVEAEPRSGDGASLDPSGPVFEGEPLLDWGLPGMAVAPRAC